MPSETYNVGCFLLDRLAEVGCGHLFGVPGDYNLRFLDDVIAADNIKWIGCANELNASYAADGYSRCRRIGAVLTTYGVGELSALNGVAGAYSESSPIVHIVFGPTLEAESQRATMHHTLGDGFFQHFSMMSQNITCTTARLTPENALQDIDRVLTDVLYYKRPGYILVPSDVSLVQCLKPAAPLIRRKAELSDISLKAFRTSVEEMLKKSKNPAALVGYLCDRYECHDIAQKLMDDAGIPFAHMLLGKATLNEQSPNYVGCYYGKSSEESVIQTIEGADVCILLGVKFHDFGTAFFSQKIDEESTINILPFCARVGKRRFQQISMRESITAVLEIAMKYSSAWPKSHPAPPTIPKPENDNFSARHFWTEFQKGLAPNDILVVDIGTSSSAAAGLVMPENSKLLLQCLWGSIGYSIPAAFGAQIAEPDRRVILCVGDGSAQMTAQELGSFLRHDMRSLIFLINNDGYVIERIIHGWNAEYNDIASWNWCPLIKAMSTVREPITSTVKEVNKTYELMKNAQGKRDKLTFTEVILGRHEMPVVDVSFKPN